MKSLYSSFSRRLLVGLALAGASVAGARAEVILFNEYNFPDPVLRDWLENTYIPQHAPAALGTAVVEVPAGSGITTTVRTIDTQPDNGNMGFMGALAATPSVSSQITDLRCLRWFPQVQYGDFTQSGHNWSSLKYLDLSGLNISVLKLPEEDANVIEYIRVRGCTYLTQIVLPYTSHLSVLDTEGCTALQALSFSNTGRAVPLRYLDLSSSADFRGNQAGQTQNLSFTLADFPQMNVLKLPSNPTYRLTSFTLTQSQVTELDCAILNGSCHNLNLTNNRLKTLDITVGENTASYDWWLDGNNFQALRLRASNTSSMPNISSCITSSRFNSGPAMDFHPVTFALSGGTTIGTITDGSGVTIDNTTSTDDIKVTYNTGAYSGSYKWTCLPFTGVSYTAHCWRAQEPMTIKLETEYYYDEGSKTVRKGNLRTFTTNQFLYAMPGVYQLANIDYLVGPYTITATASERDGGAVYTFYGMNSDATWNDVPETPTNYYGDRTLTSELPYSSLPICLTDHQMENQKLQVAYKESFATDGTSSGADVANLANFPLTTVNTWNGTGVKLNNVTIIIECRLGRPLVDFTIAPQTTTAIEDIWVDGPGESANEGQDALDAAPVEWYTLQGTRVSEPAPGAVYIRRQGTQATKVRL